MIPDLAQVINPSEQAAVESTRPSDEQHFETGVPIRNSMKSIQSELHLHYHEYCKSNC